MSLQDTWNRELHSTGAVKIRVHRGWLWLSILAGALLIATGAIAAQVGASPVISRGALLLGVLSVGLTLYSFRNPNYMVVSTRGLDIDVPGGRRTVIPWSGFTEVRIVNFHIHKRMALVLTDEASMAYLSRLTASERKRQAEIAKETGLAQAVLLPGGIQGGFTAMRFINALKQGPFRSHS